MIKEAEPHSQEFTLPFVGREEELQFLLNEYDQMLHAQYRSVWIEAPAGMGKTTLVDEFLKRISVPDGDHLQDGLHLLKPWIVHAHLRERSSNSLASFVEALGATLHTLSEKQREKLFSGLTGIYPDRARKIVSGGNVQKMDMEEAITTAGFILKQLSKYFPLVIIIEDMHVLKGEMSFYALRHLQALTEHVPNLTLFISRPSEEKYFRGFQELTIKEGSTKYELKSMKYEDVKTLAQTTDEKKIKKLMHLSGGNALLLVELLRSGTIDDTINSHDSVTARSIHYLTKELEKLPKNDRQVITIAAVLGEEFSEQLLEEITESKNYDCWTNDALSRLEHRGIIRRQKKELVPEHANKKEKITIRVAVFSHALWWEAARKLYERDKKNNKWNDKKFAEAIVSLLSHADYPLLTDAELLVNLLTWTPRKRWLTLLVYISGISGVESRWNFHSHDEQEEILRKAHRLIADLVSKKSFHCDRDTLSKLEELLNAEAFSLSAGSSDGQSYIPWYDLIIKLHTPFFKSEPHAIVIAVFFSETRARKSLLIGNEKEWRKAYQYALSLKKKYGRHADPNVRIMLDMVPIIIAGLREEFRNPERAVELYSVVVRRLSDSQVGLAMALLCLQFIANQELPRKKLSEALLLAEEFLEKALRRPDSKFTTHIIRTMQLVIIKLYLRLDFMPKARQLAQEISETYQKLWLPPIEDFLHRARLLEVYAYTFETAKSNEILSTVFPEEKTQTQGALFSALLITKLQYLEDWPRIEKLWRTYKSELISKNPRVVVPFLESRILMCLLLKDNSGCDEALRSLRMLPKQYPLLQHIVEVSLNKVNIFLSLRTHPFHEVDEDFKNFLASDTTASLFDKAYYTQLFARIAAEYGHAPVQMKSYVNFSLKKFIKLGLDERVVFTAEKFYETKLLSENDYKKILAAYSTIESESKKKNIVETPDEKELTGAENQRGITLCCLGSLRAFDPMGKEIKNPRLGTRQATPSYYKIILAELIRARLEGRTLGREELLLALFPQLSNGSMSEKKKRMLGRRLSVFLPHLRSVFAPYTVIEKTDDGYRLHSSVNVDLVDVKEGVKKVRSLVKKHLPSALWILEKNEQQLGGGEFVSGIQTKSVVIVRKEIQQLREETRLQREEARSHASL